MQITRPVNFFPAYQPGPDRLPVPCGKAQRFEPCTPVRVLLSRETATPRAWEYLIQAGEQGRFGLPGCPQQRWTWALVCRRSEDAGWIS